ncbi:MAG: ribosomal-processing cysteine protease Prp [Christensenellales bacterium]
MTTVRIVRKGNSIISIECEGHTGYGVEGEDIVCAALSSVVQTGLLGLLHYVSGVEYERDDEAGYLKIKLPDNLDEAERHDADLITGTMLLGISDLHEGFSDFIELEVK